MASVANSLLMNTLQVNPSVLLQDGRGGLSGIGNSPPAYSGDLSGRHAILDQEFPCLSRLNGWRKIQNYFSPAPGSGNRLCWIATGQDYPRQRR